MSAVACVCVVACWCVRVRFWTLCRLVRYGGTFCQFVLNVLCRLDAGEGNEGREGEGGLLLLQ